MRLLIVSLAASILCALNVDAQGIDSSYHLIAHRGGITDHHRYQWNSIEALDAAIKRGYSGVEIDIRSSKDGILFLYHNPTFRTDYDTDARCADLTWNEIQKLRPLDGHTKPPVSMEEYCGYAKGKIKDIMLDIKVKHPSKTFYGKLENILRANGLLRHSYFIGHGGYFRGKGLITMLIKERKKYWKKYKHNTGKYYFLFAGIDELNSRLINWCKDNQILLMACVNRPWRKAVTEQDIENADKDLSWLKTWGVRYYQIDSDYDSIFINKIRQ